MKHAFIIQAHAYPELLDNILRIWHAPNHYFFIHIDKKYKKIQDFIDITKCYDNIIFLQKRMNINWGGSMQFRLTLKLLEMAQDYPVSFDYYHLLSGQDFPCCNNIKFDYFFERHNGYSYMFYDQTVYTEKYHQRVTPFSLNDVFNQRSRFHWFKNRLEGILSRVIHRQEIPNLRGGWQWFSWHEKVVEYVLRYVYEHPNYLKRFKYTSCCDELFFHTMLYPKLHELNIISNNSLRFIVWNPKRIYSSLPLVLEETEFEELKDSGALFCRKVDPIKSKKLMQRIENELINK